MVTMELKNKFGKNKGTNFLFNEFLFHLGELLRKQLSQLP